MASPSIQFTTPKDPIGRFVAGSITKGQDKDADGKPLVAKNGPNLGKQMYKFYMAVAIPKNGTKGWWETEYGAKVLKVGQDAFGPIAQTPAFAWKIEDGDSTIPNKKGRTNATREGFPGNWILNMSLQVFEPVSPIQTYNANGSAPIPATEIKCGDYVQVIVGCKGNDSTQNPGIYLNPLVVALAGHGTPINIGVDVANAGLGGAVLPPGASLTPIGGMGTPVAAPAAAGAPYSPPPMPGAYVPPVAPTAAPNPAILAMPGTMGGPGAPPAPTVPAAPMPPSAGPQMTAKANGVPLADFLSKGWNLDLLKREGYIA